MKPFLRWRTRSLSILILLVSLMGFTHSASSQDLCTAPQSLAGVTCASPYLGTLRGMTATAGVATGCGGNTLSADQWFTFTPQTAYPSINLTAIGSRLQTAGALIQLFSVSPCAGAASISCVSVMSSATLTMTTTALNGGTGLTPGALYYVRIATANNSPITTAGSAAQWTYDICVSEPTSTAKFDYSKSYVNITKLATGGPVTPGDILEIRATFVATGSGTYDSLAFYDTLTHLKGLALVPNSITLRTNEGKSFVPGLGGYFSDAWDADAGDRRQVGVLDTAIRINLGPNANGSVRGKLSNASLPSFYGGSCIVMATYRVQVYGAYNSKVNFGGGALTYRDQITGVLKVINFPNDSIIVYQSPGLCPNAVSVTNAVGVETNGTFGAPLTGTPLARNRGTSAYVVGYTFGAFKKGGASPDYQGPQDYQYGITNNTAALPTMPPINTYAKPDPGGNAPNSHRVFGLWDITGDHTNASNPAKGNPPCDTTKVVSVTNPCGYMLVVNSAYKTDTAFQYQVTNLCPNTYYEISAWVKNMCSKCGCDSTGKGASSVGYIPTAASDSEGVAPNLAFEVDGTDYYTTGNINYTVTTGATTDVTNTWVKKGFTYLSGSTGSFTLTIRNNAPGGGGNDWALDDITVATCLPNMKYSPSNAPTVCTLNVVTVYDTITSYFNNYTYWKWQKSTDGGVTWTDVVGANGTGAPAPVTGGYQYVANYTIPPGSTTIANNGDKYRVVVATTPANISNTNCIVTDGGIITLSVLACPPPLAVKLVSFNGKLVNDHANLSWRTTHEDEIVQYTVEKSPDGTSFIPIGTVNGNTISGETNDYSFIDPVLSDKTSWYRILITNIHGDKKYSNVIQLGKNQQAFAFGNVINPFNNELAFDVVSSKNTRIDVTLVDIFGKTVRTKSYTIYNGVSSLSMENTDGLPAGTYVLQVSNGETVLNKQVLKK